MNLANGIYEQVINHLIERQLENLETDTYYIETKILDKEEAAKILTLYVTEIILLHLRQITGEFQIQNQIKAINEIISLLSDEKKGDMFENNLISTEGKLLTAILSKLNLDKSDPKLLVKEITPYTRLSHSELFTGNNAGIALDTELKKEISSSNKILLIVSFIKWTGIRILKKELEEFTNNGGQLKIITTTYLGATDYKAIEFLSTLKNTEIRISYNNSNERLHAKAYLFIRDTGYHTGYIGSSNFSKSALTSGLEWNVKVTNKELPHVIQKFENTFYSYWQDSEFQLFNLTEDGSKLYEALKNSDFKKSEPTNLNFFSIKPYHFQQEILENLEAERSLHNRFRNLVVAATGTGKTVISAFDFRNFLENNPNAKFLFVAHRKEILTQSLKTFREILRDNNFGELWVDGIEPGNYRSLFASVQTLKNRLESLRLNSDYFDYIIIDEVHHIAAESYRSIINYFKPKILLGLTATPERMDGSNILSDFDNTIAAEIRLPEAINRKLLTPFQYFGISDNTDLSNVSWKNGQYSKSELTQLYINSDNRTNSIIINLNKYLTDPQNVRALCFCVTQDHAEYMSIYFKTQGLKAEFLTSGNSERREEIRNLFLAKEINYLFVVDIFNEGVDIPEIDTVLFLRPTESLTIFLQQLGRGLRLSENKDCLTVLDFVANCRPEYDFESKFRQIIGKTETSVKTEIENDFPHLPLGCSVILEKVAKEYILNNIRKATTHNKRTLILKIKQFPLITILPLTLKNFVEVYNIPLAVIYSNGYTWKKLLFEANLVSDYDDTYEKNLSRLFEKKWLSCNSFSYLSFVLELAKEDFQLNKFSIEGERQIMLLMLYYDFWQEKSDFNTLQESIEIIGKNLSAVEEIIEFLEYYTDKIKVLEKSIDFPYTLPLRVHSRYTRDQILAAFEAHNFNRRSSNREGVLDLPSKKTELLFVTLEKSEENYSPTTMYDDFAISDTIFHWQSQNKTRPEIGKGLSYIKHIEENKIILLFAREKEIDEFGNTMGYVFLGISNYKSHYGEKPMSIHWELKEPIPPYLWKNTAKLAVG